MTPWLLVCLLSGGQQPLPPAYKSSFISESIRPPLFYPPPRLFFNTGVQLEESVVGICFRLCDPEDEFADQSVGDAYNICFLDRGRTTTCGLTALINNQSIYQLHIQPIISHTINSTNHAVSCLHRSAAY